MGVSNNGKRVGKTRKLDAAENPEYKDLTPMQLHFAQLVVNGLEPEKAAKEAGYSASRTKCYQLVEIPAVKNYIDRNRVKVVMERTKKYSPDEVWANMRILWDMTMGTFEPQFRWDNASRSKVPLEDDLGRFVVKMDLASGVKLAELQAKLMGMLVDKIQVDGSITDEMLNKLTDQEQATLYLLFTKMRS